VSEEDEEEGAFLPRFARTDADELEEDEDSTSDDRVTVWLLCVFFPVLQPSNRKRDQEKCLAGINLLDSRARRDKAELMPIIAGATKQPHLTVLRSSSSSSSSLTLRGLLLNSLGISRTKGVGSGKTSSPRRTAAAIASPVLAGKHKEAA
jgi:hypothetical protein